MRRKTKLNTQLKPNDVIEIYTDYKEEVTYEGKAILIEKIKDGDSFYLDKEQLIMTDQKVYSEEDKKDILRYRRLKTFFRGTKKIPPDKELVSLYKDLVKQRKDKVDDFQKMENIIDGYREKYKNSVYKIKTVLVEYDNYYIIRFIQQLRENWRPSIFSYERWKVKFIEDDAGWDVDFVTNRNIRVLKCVNPSEGVRRSELVQFTTYDSIPSIQYGRIRNKKKWWAKQNNEDESISEEEIDDLIIKKLSKDVNESSGRDSNESSHGTT